MFKIYLKIKKINNTFIIINKSESNNTFVAKANNEPKVTLCQRPRFKCTSNIIQSEREAIRMINSSSTLVVMGRKSLINTIASHAVIKKNF